MGVAREPGGRRRWISPTLALGALIILACEALLVVDVHARGGVIAGHGAALPEPRGLWQTIARQAAINITPICWAGYLLLLDGLLARLGPGGSPIRRRPRRFAWCFLTSVPIWVLFDWINFGFIHAWDYHNLPQNWLHRNLGYLVAFGAINPGMFLSAELISRFGIGGMRGPRIVIGLVWRWALIALGVASIAVAFVVRAPVASVPLWLAMPLVCDSVCAMVGASSIQGDLRDGRWGRFAALLAGGLWCGFLWEFWNYWAVAKWTYDLGFLGVLRRARYFEMPLPGLLGFLPFAAGCWAAFALIAWATRRIRRLACEPLPDDRAIL